MAFVLCIRTVWPMAVILWHDWSVSSCIM